MDDLSTRDWVLISAGALAVIAVAGVAIGMTIHHHGDQGKHKRRR